MCCVPKIFALFCSLSRQIHSLLPSLKGRFVEFWCLKCRGPEMCTIGVLWLSCEAPAAPKPKMSTPFSLVCGKRTLPRIETEDLLVAFKTSSSASVNSSPCDHASTQHGDTTRARKSIVSKPSERCDFKVESRQPSPRDTYRRNHARGLAPATTAFRGMPPSCVCCVDTQTRHNEAPSRGHPTNATTRSPRVEHKDEASL